MHSLLLQYPALAIASFIKRIYTLCTWVEATYQNAKTCSVCRTVEGQALEADFEKYGLTNNMFESKHYHEKTQNSVTDSQDIRRQKTVKKSSQRGSIILQAAMSVFLFVMTDLYLDSAPLLRKESLFMK